MCANGHTIRTCKPSIDKAQEPPEILCDFRKVEEIVVVVASFSIVRIVCVPAHICAKKDVGMRVEKGEREVKSENRVKKTWETDGAPSLKQEIRILDNNLSSKGSQTV